MKFEIFGPEASDAEAAPRTRPRPRIVERPIFLDSPRTKIKWQQQLKAPLSALP